MSGTWHHGCCCVAVPCSACSVTPRAIDLDFDGVTLCGDCFELQHFAGQWWSNLQMTDIDLDKVRVYQDPDIPCLWENIPSDDIPFDWHAVAGQPSISYDWFHAPDGAGAYPGCGGTPDSNESHLLYIRLYKTSYTTFNLTVQAVTEWPASLHQTWIYQDNITVASQACDGPFASTNDLVIGNCLAQHGGPDYVAHSGTATIEAP